MMNTTTFQAMILGFVQGLTEFLPVSSSGHLVLFQNLFGLREPELLLDIALHMGTLLAVVVVFAREIGELFTALVQLPRLWREAVEEGFTEGNTEPSGDEDP